MHYTLRQIEVFLATAHFENVTQAANSLAMSQSAASSALQDLEQRFDIQLFDRAGKRVQLSELGKALRPRAEALLAQAREFEHSLTQRTDVAELKVGATLTIGNYLAVPIMAEFMNLHPDARVSLTVENTAAIASRVRNFELDIGLIEGELQDPVLEVIPWREDELALFCAPGHPLADQRTLSDADLLTARWVVREAGSGTRQARPSASGPRHLASTASTTPRSNWPRLKLATRASAVIRSCRNIALNCGWPSTGRSAKRSSGRSSSQLRSCASWRARCIAGAAVSISSAAGM